jgi:hypothetical protein
MLYVRYVVTSVIVVINRTVARDGYFFDGLNILISTFCTFCTFKVKSFSLPCIINNFLFASLKVLTNLENAY